jgi:hypothetical protein
VLFCLLMGMFDQTIHRIPGMVGNVLPFAGCDYRSSGANCVLDVDNGKVIIFAYMFHKLQR